MPSPVSHHFGIQPFLKVSFPLWVKGIGFGLDFDVSVDGDMGRFDQLLGSIRTVLLFEYPIEAAVAFVLGTEVFSVYPALAFVAMTPFCPAPQSLVHLIVDVCEGLFANHMAVVVGPTSDNGVEFGNQLTSRQMVMGLDDGTNFEQQGLDALFGWFDEQLAFVLTDILAQEIKALFNIRHFRFLGG